MYIRIKFVPGCIGLAAKLQVLSTYKERLVWETRWSHEQNKVKNSTEEAESQSEELKKA